MYNSPFPNYAYPSYLSSFPQDYPYSYNRPFYSDFGLRKNDLYYHDYITKTHSSYNPYSYRRPFPVAPDYPPFYSNWDDRYLSDLPYSRSYRSYYDRPLVGSISSYYGGDRSLLNADPIYPSLYERPLIQPKINYERRIIPPYYAEPFYERAPITTPIVNRSFDRSMRSSDILRPPQHIYDNGLPPPNVYDVRGPSSVRYVEPPLERGYRDPRFYDPRAEPVIFSDRRLGNSIYPRGDPYYDREFERGGRKYYDDNQVEYEYTKKGERYSNKDNKEKEYKTPNKEKATTKEKMKI